MKKPAIFVKPVGLYTDASIFDGKITCGLYIEDLERYIAVSRMQKSWLISCQLNSCSIAEYSLRI